MEQQTDQKDDPDFSEADIESGWLDEAADMADEIGAAGLKDVAKLLNELGDKEPIPYRATWLRDTADLLEHLADH